jgi:DNA-binding PadR family transcriptional regulator
MSTKMLDMTLTEREANVIRQLIAREKYGRELVAGSEGLIRRNAVYVLLGRMEDKGLIEGREEATPEGESGPPRRVYKVTGLGERCLAAYEAGEAIMTGAPILGST